MNRSRVRVVIPDDRIGINILGVVLALVAIAILSIIGFVAVEDDVIVVALSTGLLGGLAGYCVGYAHADVKLWLAGLPQKRGRRR